MVVTPLATDISDRLFVFLVWSGLMVAASIAVPFPSLERVFLGAGGGLLLLAAIGGGLQLRHWIIGRWGDLIARRALRAQSCPAVVADGAGRVVFTNKAAARLPGARAGVALGDFLARNFGLSRRFHERLAARGLAEGRSQENITFSGRHLHVDARLIGPDRLLWTFDQRGYATDAAPEAERVAIVSLAPDGRILCVNTPASALLGQVPRTAEELFGDAVPISCETREVRGAEGPVTVTCMELRNDEGWRDIAFFPVADLGAAPAAEILAEPGLLEALPVPMLKISVEGLLIEANREARAILSLDTGPLPELFELVEGMGRPITDWLADAAQGRGLLKPEIVRAVRPGQELFLQITLGRTVEQGKTVLVGILNDATELKTLEAQFVQSQKMQAIGQLAGGVAHDFNNLLTAISGHCDLLLLRHDPGDPEYSDLIQISQNSNRAASLVGQLLAFSRKQNLKPQALDLRDTMSDLAHLLNRLIGERIQLEVIHAPGVQVIRADRRQLEQVIVNLVVNARDAMPAGGRIVVNIRHHTLESELVRDRAHVPPGDYVVIEVQDTGTGIPPDGISKIFEPFYTTKKTGEGTGLGLSTAYGIVKQTGGYIFVDSEMGKGSLFSLYFPIADLPKEPAEPAAGAEVRVMPARSGGVVLLVEDEAPVRAFASRALRMRGYTVLEAENAEEALDKLDDPDLKVDVFVTDVVMPGLDGPTWVQRALKDRPDTRTVFVSGYSEEGRVEQQSRIPNSVFLPKPFSLQQLTTVVNEQFR
jgi:two-component system cell cycle sensor histidine kinase/response regulator CckA